MLGFDSTNVNHVALATTVTAASVTLGSACMITAAASTAAKVACIALFLISVSALTGSVVAWRDQNVDNVDDYFAKVASQSGTALVTIVQDAIAGGRKAIRVMSFDKIIRLFCGNNHSFQRRFIFGI